MITHPDEGTPFVDYFGRAINVGDIIVYPTCTGSSSAELIEAVVEKVVALVEHPGGPWISTGPNSRVPFVREDQLNRSHPTEYKPTMIDWRSGVVDFKRAYVLVVRTRGGYGSKAHDGYSGRTQTVKNVSNVIISAPSMKTMSLPLSSLPGTQQP